MQLDGNMEEKYNKISGSYRVTVYDMVEQ